MMYYQQTLTDSFTALPSKIDNADRIREELRTLYYGHFDSYWLLSLLEQNAFSLSRLRSVQNMLELQSAANTDPAIFNDGIEVLDEVILTAKRYIIPSLRDKLKISGFYRNSSEPKDDVIMRNMFSYTFPYNLHRLEELVEELKNALK